MSESEEARDSESVRRRRRFEALLGLPFEEGNRIEVLRNGKEIFPAMLGAIEEATQSIDFLTFVYWGGEIAEQFAKALVAKAREGLRVRVLLDAYGAFSMPDRLERQLRESGAQVQKFRDLGWRFWKAAHRTHRKVMICDGRVGFTGGVGVAEEWTGDARNPSEWRETHFRIEGPAVLPLSAAFYTNWVECCGFEESTLEPPPRQPNVGSAAIQVVRSSASVDWSDVAYVLRLCLVQVQRRLRITTAYFVPDDESVALLIAAAKRGVDVEIMLPGKHTDSRFTRWGAEDRFSELLEAGVRIWNYDRTMLHAKLLTMDGQLACIGSANYNHRSLSQDDEVLLVVDDEAFARTLDEQFDEDLAVCSPALMGSDSRRGVLSRFGQLMARLVRRGL